MADIVVNLTTTEIDTTVTGDTVTVNIITATGSTGVTSFNGRTGVVVPATDDYTADQITETVGRVYITAADKTDLTDGNASTLHYHDTDRARSNHTGTQTASTISDFDTEVSNNTDVSANTTHRSSDGKDHSDVVLNNAHRVSTSNPHSVTASQVSAIALNATGAIGNLTATPSFTGSDGTVYTATYSANVTSWAGITLANGACICLAEIDNTGGYSVATTGLTAMESGALDDIASDDVNLFIAKLNNVLYARATVKP